MAKRLTDTAKWRKPWIQELAPEHKLLWLYICDECDHAGVWDVEMRVAEARLGVKLDRAQALLALAGKVVEIDEGSKWFINGFLDFQYSNAKGSMSKCIVSARKRLESLGLSFDDLTLSEPLAKGYETLKVKVKVKVKDKVSLLDSTGKHSDQDSFWDRANKIWQTHKGQPLQWPGPKSAAPIQSFQAKLSTLLDALGLDETCRRFENMATDRFVQGSLRVFMADPDKWATKRMGGSGGRPTGRNSGNVGEVEAKRDGGNGAGKFGDVWGDEEQN